MSAYDDAAAYLDAEVHPRCDYDIYSDMRDIVDEMEEEKAKLRELVRDYHTFLALAELAQPIGSIIAAHGHPTLSVKALDKRYRKLGVEVSA